MRSGTHGHASSSSRRPSHGLGRAGDRPVFASRPPAGTASAGPSGASGERLAARERTGADEEGGGRRKPVAKSRSESRRNRAGGEASASPSGGKSRRRDRGRRAVIGEGRDRLFGDEVEGGGRVGPCGDRQDGPRSSQRRFDEILSAARAARGPERAAPRDEAWTAAAGGRGPASHAARRALRAGASQDPGEGTATVEDEERDQQTVGQEPLHRSGRSHADEFYLRRPERARTNIAQSGEF